MNAIIQTIANFFNAVFSWFARVFEWLGGMFKDGMEFVLDLPLVILRGFLDGVIYLLSAIPPPDFLTAYSLGHMFGQLPPSLLFFVQVLDLHLVGTILAAGVAFRLTRKAVTLGQW